MLKNNGADRPLFLHCQINLIKLSYRYEKNFMAITDAILVWYRLPMAAPTPDNFLYQCT